MERIMMGISVGDRKTTYTGKICKRKTNPEEMGLCETCSQKTDLPDSQDTDIEDQEIEKSSTSF